MFLSESLDIGSVFEFLLSFFIELFKVPLFILLLDGLIGIEGNGLGDFGHGEVGVFVGLQRDGLVPTEEIDLVEAKLITHIIVYKVTNKYVWISKE